MQPQAEDLGMTKHIEQSRLLAAQHLRQIRCLAAHQSGNACPGRAGQLALDQIGNEFIADEADRIIDPVRCDDADFRTIMAVDQGNQHVAVGAQTRAKLHEKARQVAARSKPARGIRRLFFDGKTGHYPQLPGIHMLPGCGCSIRSDQHTDLYEGAPIRRGKLLARSAESPMLSRNRPRRVRPLPGHSNCGGSPSLVEAADSVSNLAADESDGKHRNHGNCSETRAAGLSACS